VARRIPFLLAAVLIAMLAWSYVLASNALTIVKPNDESVGYWEATSLVSAPSARYGDTAQSGQAQR
jgi:hypothetical protein